MPIYMNYDNIPGPVTTKNLEKWIECSSFSWGVGRAIGTAARGAVTREHSEPHIAEIVLTKPMDVSSPKLFRESLAGKLDKKVVLKFTTTTGDGTDTFLKIELEGTGISSYSWASGGSNPDESLSLNFTKIMYTFTGMNPDITGSPDTVGYDLKAMIPL